MIVWERIVELFADISPEITTDLKALGYPTWENMLSTNTYINNIDFPVETYLLIDNYHLIGNRVAAEFLDAISIHRNPKLHIVILTQPTKVGCKTLIHNDYRYFIDAEAFYFDKEEIDKLLQLEGLRLSKDELDRIFDTTKGWVAAIRLYIKFFKDMDGFSFSAHTERLVESAVWNYLDSEEKDFLLGISTLDNFTAAQAVIMIEAHTLPEKIVMLLKNNEFIYYTPEDHTYRIHNMLQSYLRNRFYNLTPKEYQDHMFRKAGESYAAASETYLAAKFYYKIKDFNAILSLPFTIECMDKQKGKSYCEFIIDIADECPDEIWRKYPFAMIVFGYYALLMGQTYTYQKLNNLIEEILQERSDFCTDALRKIEGEYILLTLIADFENLPQRITDLEKALSLLGGASQMLSPNVEWMFSTPSVLSLFWREPGMLERLLDEVDESAQVYEILSNNQGAGYHLLMREEAMLLRGNADAAEVLCYEAHYLARSHKQTSICICADFVIARSAMLKGDAATFFTALESLRQYAEEEPEPNIIYTVEYCMSAIGITLGIEDYIAPWFYDVEKIRELLYAPIVPFAEIIYLGLLLMRKRYHEFYGICHQVLNRTKHGEKNNTMVRLQTLLLLAVAEHNNGRQKESQVYLRQALEMTVQDRLYLPFFYLPHLEMYFADRPSSAFEGSNMAQIKTLYERQQSGMNIIRKAIIRKKSPLTRREREVALLAKERLTAQEIADELFISSATVKTILRSVYTKLDVHSRGELASRDF